VKSASTHQAHELPWSAFPDFRRASKRDLPCANAQCHRNEPAGGLHGIMRVSVFLRRTIIFSIEDQILKECGLTPRCCKKVYTDFGFKHHLLLPHANGPHRHRRKLDKAEHALMESLGASVVILKFQPGDERLYPKIEYTP
jgi:threonyl-tRNA synthetase